MKYKIKRVIYRLWHNRSSSGRVGYVGKDKYYPRRTILSWRVSDTKSPKLYRALNKYPLKFWCVDVLASGFRSDASLSAAEILYIKKFNSKNKGYNCTDGGEGGLNPTAEVREKISRSRRGKVTSKAVRAKQSAAKLGDKHPNWGKHLPLSTRKKIVLSRLGRKNPNWGGKLITKEWRQKQRKAHTWAPEPSAAKEIIRSYVKELLNPRQIKIKFSLSVDPMTIRIFLIRNGVKMRIKSEALKIVFNKRNK